MQSHQDTFGSDSLKNRGHRRSDTLGKSMPITSLLLNYTPSRLQTSENIRSDAGSCGGNISPTQQELPPLYFPIHESSPSLDVVELKKSSDQPLDTDEEVEILEQEYEILVSECSSSNGDPDHDDGDERRKSNSEEYISLIGNSKFYTPCLTCAGSEPTELTTRSSAINEMCRRLCTEECRLRLSLAGLVTPSETILKNRQMLEEYVKDSLEKIQKESKDTPPKLPPRPVNKRDTINQSTITPPDIILSETISEVIPPVLPKRPPANIAIQRKKFLTDILMQNSKYHNDLLSSDDEEFNTSQSSRDLLDIVTSIVIPPPPPTPTASSPSPLNTISKPNLEKEDVDIPKTIQVDPHELAMLKDFREKFEIAEALAKTSAMTSTSKIKQRLAARKLEIELDNAKAIAAAAQTKHDNETAHAACSCSHKNNSSGSGGGGDAGADDIHTRQTGLACNDDDACCAQGVPDAVTKQNLTQKNLDAASPYYDDYEPPRDLLLYLVRMGSFNSAPKINNSDSQDDTLDIPKDLSTPELLQHVKHLRGDNQPPLLSRFFLKPLTTLSAQMVSSDITDGLRCLKLNSLSRVCSAPLSDPNHIRLLQWNLLSQTLGQNNDGFVRCPDEALTWENRKFLIVQEILQNTPDIVCLQEVDHFKFLQNILGTQNYGGIFFPKPDSPCLYIEENNGPDGCAIFYNRDKFELKNFETRILEVWRVQSNQVAIAANLKVKATGQEICVCTTHLKARHGSLLSKLRNEQGRDLIRFVKQFAGDRAVLLCGDFNAEPVEPVYSTILNCEFLKLSSAYSDIRAESDECNNESTKEQLENCDKVQKSIQNEPPYTTWKIREDGEECHTIDYVFYTKDNLKVKNCLEFPHGDEIGKNRTPSFQYPSDHFSLICDFEIVDQQANKSSSSASLSSSEGEEEAKSKTQ